MQFVKATAAVLLLLVAGILPCLAQSAGAPIPPPDLPVSDADQARLECKTICPKAFAVKLQAEEQRKLMACIAIEPTCLKKPSGFIAGRDLDPQTMVGKQLPDILFNRPDFLRRGLGPGLVDG